MSVEISNGAILTIVGSVVTAGLGWILRAERKLGDVLTRTQHDEICENRQQILEHNLREIKAMLVETNREAREHRQRISTALAASDKEAQRYRDKQSKTLKRLEVEIAVLQTKRGITPSEDDTGNYPTESTDDG